MSLLTKTHTLIFQHHLVSPKLHLDSSRVLLSPPPLSSQFTPLLFPPPTSSQFSSLCFPKILLLNKLFFHLLFPPPCIQNPSCYVVSSYFRSNKTSVFLKMFQKNIGIDFYFF